MSLAITISNVDLLVAVGVLTAVFAPMVASEVRYGCILIVVVIRLLAL